MISGAEGNIHHDFARQEGFHEMIAFPQEDLPSIKACKGAWAQSPWSDECLCNITHTGGS